MLLVGVLCSPLEMLLLALLLAGAPPVEVQRPHDGEVPNLALSWSTGGASACPERQQVIEAIANSGLREQLGTWVPSQHAQALLSVEVELSVDGDIWRADMLLIDPDGQSRRQFEASSCQALADATALIVAVTLDPIAVSGSIADAKASDPTPDPIREPPPEPRLVEPELPPEPEPEDGTSTLGVSSSDAGDGEPAALDSRVRVGLSLHGGGGFGPTAGAHGSVGARAALLGDRWRVDVAGRWSTPRRETLASASGSFDAWTIEARGCFVPIAGPVELPLCPGFELGSVRGRGRPPTPNPTTSSFLWLAPSLSQGLTWAVVPRFAIGIELGLLAPLTRGRFAVGGTPIEQLAVFGVRGLASLELRI
jgi:hypothetical protein